MKKSPHPQHQSHLGLYAHQATNAYQKMKKGMQEDMTMTSDVGQKMYKAKSNEAAYTQRKAYFVKMFGQF